jgi:aminopeptidase N
MRPERSCFDVTHYDLDIRLNPSQKTIEGQNTITFKVTQPTSRIQLDLFENLKIKWIKLNNPNAPDLNHVREYNAIFVDLPRELKAGETQSVVVGYGGKPQEAFRAPWDGGFVWKQDPAGKPWVGVACEGTGASLWWPCKDHLSDEPDSMRISVEVPQGLSAVCNGNLRKASDLEGGWTRFEWGVSYPINNYNVTVNVADYAHFHDTYTNASGTHDLDYYVLRHNEEKAKKQFQQVKPMLEIYERAFGEYPFWKDGYALVETHYLGMEHQGAIAYGNHYLSGYDGFDPLGLGFDYIIIHETGHEWWGNSVSCKDHAELWIHESFCTYSEAIYVEAIWGKEMATKYLMNQRGQILNASPVVGPLDVNFDGWMGSDMYYKGAWMLHTLRNQVNDDQLWWATIRSFAEDFRFKNTDTKEVMAYFNKKLGKDFGWLFDQYLFVASAPVLEYKVKAKGGSCQLSCRWVAKPSNFSLKINVLGGENPVSIQPTTTLQKFDLPIEAEALKFDFGTWYGKVKKMD